MATSMQECKYCLIAEGDMISCASCKQYSHPPCLELPEHIVPVVKTYDWQCNDCKYCYACHTIADEKKILFCDSCDRGYHMYCVNPPITRKPKGDWYCNICTEMREKEAKEKVEKEKEAREKEAREKEEKEAKEKEAREKEAREKEAKEEEAPAGVTLTLVASSETKKKLNKKKKDGNRALSAEIVDLTESQRDKRKTERDKTKDVMSPTPSEVDEDEEDEEEEEIPDIVEEEKLVTPPKPAKRKYTKSAEKWKNSTEKSSSKKAKKGDSKLDDTVNKNDANASIPDKTLKEKVTKKVQTIETVCQETQTDKNRSEEKCEEIVKEDMSKKNSAENKAKDSSDDDDVALAAFTKLNINKNKCMYAKTFSNTNQCPFFGCDGSGNTRNNHHTHVSLSNCPLSRESKRREKELLGVYATNEDTTPSQQKKESMEKTQQTELKDGDKNAVSQTPIENIVSESDIEMFQAAKQKALKEMRKEMAPHPDGLKSIIFGNIEIDAWYKSQYAHEYSMLPKIYVCEFCLNYMKTETLYKRHLAKCTVRYPPGDEIYRKDKMSVFEIDGANATVYCQNLCLMSKLFLDHKTLWHDVAPFLFYIMTKSDERGCHIIGYFSKEKVSFLNYNVSCILVLPHHMRQGYGRLLIDFSYLLTATEGKTGSPERPFSDMGLMSYRKFWAEKLLDYISNYPEKETISIKGISEKMAMQATDVISTLQYLGMLKYWKGKHVIALRTEVMAEYATKVKQRPKDYKEIDVNCLTWTPPSSRTTLSTK